MTATINAPFIAPAVEVDEDVDYLVEMNGTEFRDFVFRSIPEDTPGRVWRALLHDDIAIRTKNVLARIITELGAETKERAAQPMTDDEAAVYAVWRAERNAFMVEAGHRQHNAKQATAALAARPLPRQDSLGFAQTMRTLVRDLATAINEHRLATIDAGIDPEPHDEELWEILDELSPPALFVGGPEPTLAELLLSGKWALGRLGRPR